MKSFGTFLFLVYVLLLHIACGGDSADRPYTHMSHGVGGEGDGGGAADVSSSSSVGTGGSAPDVPTISLASSPVSTTGVKKAQNVEVVGLTIAAGPETVTVHEFTLSAQAFIADCAFGEPCARSSAYKRIISLAVYDDEVQVSAAASPETDTGKIFFGSVNVTIPKNSEKTFVVKAGFGSTASSEEPHDQVAVGVEAAVDVVLTNADGETVTAKLTADLQDQLGAAPSVTRTIRPYGEFTIQAAHAPSTNLVAGKNVWIPFARYEVTVEYESATIDYARIVQDSLYLSDNADFTQIAVASGGITLDTGILPAGSSGGVDISLVDNPIVVVPGTIKFVEVWGKLANVLSSAAVAGAWTGAPRSGHMPSLGFSSDIMSGEWDSAYEGNLNVRTTGGTSGERMYADKIDAPPGNLMVIRKSVPTFVKHMLPTTTLANVDLDLYKFQVSADSAGAIGFQQIVFEYVKTPELSVTNMRLRKGATDMPLSSFTAVSLPNATSGITDGAFYITLASEETIVGSGHIYTFHGTVSGAVAGQLITLSVAQDPGAMPVMDCFETADPYPILAFLGMPVGFLWSDLSEVPHSDTECDQGGLKDWITGTFVNDLGQSQTLSL